MIFKTLKLAVVVAALAVCGNATAQDCGSCGGSVVYGGTMDYAQDNCGRRITQGSAASLWAGYCNETCDYGGGSDCGCGGGCGGGCGLNLGSRLGGRLGNRGGCDSGCGSSFVSHGGGSCGGGCSLGSRGGKLRGLFSGLGGGFGGGSSCGCDMGCFGYPTGGGCGGNGGGFLSGGLLKGGCFSGLRGKLGNHGGCGGGCNMGGKLRGLFAGRSCGSKIGGLFQRSQKDCGCAGAYFGESVGYDYGNAGMQSCVSGCATNACGGPATMMSAPANDCGGCSNGASIMGGVPAGEVYMGTHDPTANAQEIPAEAVQDAADAVDALQDAAGN